MAATEGTEQQQELTAVNRIRVETTFSRFPIHRLSRTGTTVIDLYPDVQWRVSHNSDYGQPGPLAYKIDTLVINRRLDRAPRPLPELLRLGSLREICRELGQSDHDTDIVKKALHQNASAYITAKVRQTKKGRDKWVEIGYTRYSVIFTGEVLPDGNTADAVYIVLNPQHRKFLNEVEVRPLDYDYLFQLSPAPQRLYELLSFPMYGVLSNDRPRARLRYSEFCTFAPVTRYFDYDPVKKQMSKIHKPHRESGYIAKVQFQETEDAKGNRDWEMFYTPGPRAVAEFSAFSRRTIAPTVQNTEVRNVRPVQRTLELTSPPDLIEEQLVARGISPKKARELVANLQPNQLVLDQLEYTDFIIRQAPAGRFHNPPGLYIRNIENNISPPPAFEGSRQRRLRQEIEKEIDTDHARRSRLEVAYEEYVQEAVNALIANMPAEEFNELIKNQRKALKGTYPRMLKEHLDDLARVSVRASIKSSNSHSFKTFDSFCRDRELACSVPCA
jgi:hypothetical protein